MKLKKRVIAGVVTVTALAGGAAGAVAATNEGKAAEQAVLSDAAERLGVSAEELRTALGAAADARLDAAVKAGELTQEQADAIKARRQADGTVLRLGRGGHGGGPGGHRGAGRLMEEAASALGINRSELFERLRNGETLAEVAEDEGETLAQVKSAVKQAAVERLDAELQAGRITEAQHEEMVERLDEHLERLGERKAFRGQPGESPDDGADNQDNGADNQGAVYRTS